MLQILEKNNQKPINIAIGMFLSSLLLLKPQGRFGSSAKKYFKSITQNFGKGRAIYVQQIQAAIAKLNGQLFCKLARNMQVVAGPGII